MSKSIWGDEKTRYFHELGPAEILSAVDRHGYNSSGRYLMLNSMENRVYEVELEGEAPLVIKFYRPGRWSKEQIKEEHQLLKEILDQEIPVVAPLLHEGESLFLCPNTKLYYTIFPRKAGRLEAEFNDKQLEIIGRTLARIHNIGAQKKANHRLELTPNVYAKGNFEYLFKQNAIPLEFQEQFQNLFKRLYPLLEKEFEGKPLQRIHGDFHIGNILWRDENLSIVDFDDMVQGPPIQDIWLVCPGNDDYAKKQREQLLFGYEEFRDFNPGNFKLIEPLRTLRLIHYTAWIARRWEDQSFKNSFPHFGTLQYWKDFYNDLHLQCETIQQTHNVGQYY